MVGRLPTGLCKLKPESDPEEGRSPEFELKRNRQVSDFAKNHTLTLLELEPNKMSVSAPTICTKNSEDYCCEWSANNQ